MIDYKQEAEKLLEWMEDHGSAPRCPSMAYELLETHLPEFLRSFAERVRNEAIEECAVLLEQQQPETLSESLLALANVKDIRSLKQKTNGTDR